jgi:lipid-A-disaccharide synthase
MKRVFLIAGEASGDVHGALLAESLHGMSPDLEIYGAGGARMREAATAGFVESAHLHANGFTEVFRSLPGYARLFGTLAGRIREVRPDLVVFIDNPGFNLRLAKKVGASGIPMVYYICPQVWAWGEGRVELMKRLFRKALVVFQFEEEFYRKRSLPAVWVGHPLRDLVTPLEARPARPAGETRIVLLPGSRTHEVRTLLPILLKACEKIRRRLPNAQFQLIKAPTLEPRFYAEILGRAPDLRVRIVDEEKYAALRDADLALVCSGTATLECALLKVPMVVVNRASFLTYLVARAVIRVKHLAIPNLLAGETIVPELLQYACDPANVAIAAFDILENPEKAEAMRKRLEEANRKVGGAGASARAAAEILKEL